MVHTDNKHDSSHKSQDPAPSYTVGIADSLRQCSGGVTAGIADDDTGKIHQKPCADNLGDIVESSLPAYVL